MSSADIDAVAPDASSATGRGSRVAAAIALPGVAFAGLGWLLLAKSQWETGLIVLLFVAALGALDATRFGRRLASACRAEGRVANAASTAAALALLWTFREDHYALLMVSTVALFAAACVGLNIQMAFGGIANFAAAAFFAVGSYTAATLAGQTDLPHLLVLAAGGLVTALVGVLMLLPVLRTRGHYVALVTIAFGVMLRTLLEVNDTFGGPQGMKIPGFAPFGFEFGDVTTLAAFDVSFYLPYAVAAGILFALAFLTGRLLERSWAGLAIDAVRTDEIAASAFGLSPTRWKATAFLIGNVMIGVAGALHGMMNGFVNPNGAGFGESLIMLSIIVLGGLGNFWGAIVAGAVILVLPEKLQSIQEYRLLIFAAVVLAIVRFRPGGILPRPLRHFGVREGDRP